MNPDFESKNAFDRIMIIIVVFSLILLSFTSTVSGKRTFSLNAGEIETEALEGNDVTLVFITLLTPNASIDVYVLPTKIFSENRYLQKDFSPLENYTRVNLTTNITYSFRFFEDEFPTYEIILDNSDNIQENDTVPVENLTLIVKVRMSFPEIGDSAIYKGIIASFLVFLLCGSVVAKSIRNRIIKKKISMVVSEEKKGNVD
ncbi:MAG: hypothetical protein QGH39_11250 [Candidatus Thermoplasmatota archaeon]|nr:hypothetical protein [Candidatus Thermoplasmatota archaeon]